MQNYNSINISIVIPVYNEEEILHKLYNELKKYLTGELESHEIIFADDCSTDNSMQLIKELRALDSKLEYLSFSRNFGQQMAISAGLSVAKGKIVVVMDGDLQDPPCIIPAFYQKIQNGYDVVFGIRTKRKENIFKRTLYKTFYYLLNKFSTIYIPKDSGDFCIMSRKVVNCINRLPEKERFIRGLRAWVGFKQIGILYERDYRYQGKSKYSFIKLLDLAFNGLISFSDIPLKIMLYFGFVVAFIGILGIVGLLCLLLFTNVHIEARGWTSLFSIILFLGGIQITTLGLVGYYITKIFLETKNRLPYVIKEASDKGILLK